MATALLCCGQAAADSPGLRDELLFVSNRTDNLFQLHRMHADGSGVQRVLSERGEAGEMNWSPDGGKVLFTAARGGRQLQVYVITLANGQTQQLTNDASPSTSPVWSPDGLTIAFVSSRDRSRRILLMDADGTRLRRLTRAAADDEMSPQFSPDGQRVAYLAGNLATIAPRVAVADLRTGQSGMVSSYARRAIEAEPRWSPDGSRLAYLLVEGQSTHVMSMAPDGTDPQRLTPADSPRNTQPHWSPDGRQIAYQAVSAENGRLALMVMNADGSQSRRVVAGGNNILDARWSSDGQRIFFVEQMDGGGKLLSTDLAGKDIRRLSGEEGFDMSLQVCCSRLPAQVAGRQPPAGHAPPQSP